MPDKKEGNEEAQKNDFVVRQAAGIIYIYCYNRDVEISKIRYRTRKTTSNIV